MVRAQRLKVKVSLKKLWKMGKHCIST